MSWSRTGRATGSSEKSRTIRRRRTTSRNSMARTVLADPPTWTTSRRRTGRPLGAATSRLHSPPPHGRPGPRRIRSWISPPAYAGPSSMPGGLTAHGDRMSDISQGAGWWIASDSRWYPPDLHPSRITGVFDPAAAAHGQIWTASRPPRQNLLILAVSLALVAAILGGLLG